MGIAFGFKAVCVNPVHVSHAVGRLSSSERVDGNSVPIVCSVAGFPLGAGATATKVDEACRAIDDGAAEIDMVANIGALVEGDDATVRKDIEAVARALQARCPTVILKVILETGVLADERIVLGCDCCAQAGADFVKTSTGFHPSGGATIAHVRLLHRHAAAMRVKASGGISTAQKAFAMFDAGAERIGTSSGVAIIEQLRDSLP